jgi:hypothetical protein
MISEDDAAQQSAQRSAQRSARESAQQSARESAQQSAQRPAQHPVQHVTEDDTPTESFQPIRTRERRTVRLTAALAVVILAWLGLASYELVLGVGHGGKPAASSVVTVNANASAPGGTTARAGTAGNASGAPSPGQSGARTPSGGASAAVGKQGSSASASPTAPAAQTLQPVGATAFGPGPGGSGGDDPAGAASAIASGSAGLWSTDWYDTPLFGNLQGGTGLLVDMGQTVTITSVQVTLGSTPGADLQLRAGTVAGLSDLPEIASASNADGTVTLSPGQPVQARYLLVWFTQLPPDGAGTYQVKVYHVQVEGQQ